MAAVVAAWTAAATAADTIDSVVVVVAAAATDETDAIVVVVLPVGKTVGPPCACECVRLEEACESFPHFDREAWEGDTSEF